MGAEGSGGAKRGWAYIGLELSYSNTAQTSLTEQGRAKHGKAVGASIKIFKYFTKKLKKTIANCGVVGAGLEFNYLATNCLAPWAAGHAGRCGV